MRLISAIFEWNSFTEDRAQEQQKKVVVEDADNEKRYLPANSISVSSGYSWLSNDFFTANGDKLGKTPTGFDVTMEYAHLWKLKNSRRPFYIGFSINGVGSRTKLKIPRNGDDDVDEVIMNYFVGAGYKMAYKTNKRFIWNLLLSLGYACTDDDTTPQMALASMGKWDANTCSASTGRLA